MTLDLRLLEAFCTAVEHGSFTEAARILRVSQPAVSKQVKSLEVMCRTTLLERSKKGVRPTEAGLRVYAESRILLDKSSDLVQTINELTDERKRSLRICSSYTVGEYLLPKWIDTFQSIASGVTTELVIGNSETVLRELVSGNVDLCFIESGDDIPKIERVQVAEDHLLLVVGAAHKWAGRECVEGRELLNEPFISRELGSGTRTVAERAFKGAGLPFPTPDMELASTGSIKRALESGHGYALLSNYTIREDVARGSLYTPNLNGLDLSRSLDLVKTPNTSLSPTAGQFIEMILAKDSEDPRTRPA